MTALENLLNYYNQLPVTSTTKAVLRQCLAHINHIGNLTIYELADCCYTSTATISRLVKTLGYKSYSVFQSSLAEHCSRYDYHNRFSVDQISGARSPKEIVLENMAYMTDQFEKNVQPESYMPLVDALYQSKSVVIFCYGIYFMECTLQSDLIMSGIPCDIVAGDLNQLQRAKELTSGDFALFMCPDAIESTSSLRSTIEAAKKRGATICVLSSTGRQPFIHLADIVLSFSGHHYMADSFYLEMLLAVISIAYRSKYLDAPHME